MLHRPMTWNLFAGVACLSLAILPGPAPADLYFETTYLPTSSFAGVSPSLLSTSYALPTAYVVPTSYTSTYLPTTYLSTTSMSGPDLVAYPTSTRIIRRSAFRPRRYVERTYASYPLAATSYALPTTYLSTSSLVPTTYLSMSNLMPTTYLARSYVSPTSYVIDDGVVTTSGSSGSYPCETTSSGPSRAAVTRPSGTNGGDSANTITSSPSTGGMGSERRPQATLNSSPVGDQATTSAGRPAEIPEPVKIKPGGQETPPPVAPLPELDPDSIKVPDPGKSGGVAPRAGETSYRSARRPGYDGRNILRGRVISAESKQPEEGVTVIVSNVTRNFGDRPAMTDADGEFKVSLPDGDWTVKVKMPSGAVYPVGRDFVTASGGRVTDSAGRSVADFLITR